MVSRPERKGFIPLEIKRPWRLPARRAGSLTGFTLIELLVVIGVLAILATVVVLVINPTEYLNRARDSERVNDLSALKHAVQLAATSASLKGSVLDYDGAFTGSCVGAADGTPDRLFVSVPSDNGESLCNTNWQGFTITCVSGNSLFPVNGSGWVPIDFAGAFLPQSPPLSKLPVDPINTFASGYYYSYVCGSFEFAAKMQSQKFLEQAAADGGNKDSYLESGDSPGDIPATLPGPADASTGVTVSGIIPSSGTNNVTVTNISITGTGFASGATVKLTKSGQGDIAGVGFAFASPTALSGGSFNLAGVTTGSWDVVVTNPVGQGGQSGSLSGGFSVTAPAGPTVSGSNPANGNQGVNNLAVTVNGSNFASDASVAFSGTGISVTGTTVVSASQINLTVTVSNSALSTVAHNITITNVSAGQSGTCTGCFAINQVQQQTGYVKIDDFYATPPVYSTNVTLPTVPITGGIVPSYYDDISPSSITISNVYRISNVINTSNYYVIFKGFPFSGANQIPAGSTIDGICVLVNDSTINASITGIQKWKVGLSKNAGVSFSDNDSTSGVGDISTSVGFYGPDQFFKDSGNVDPSISNDPAPNCGLWGLALWSSTDFTDPTFQVRITGANDQASPASNLRFDVVKVKVIFKAP